MTEREKAAAGFLYDANYDEELARQRAECKDKCPRYNLCLPSDMAQQDEDGCSTGHAPNSVLVYLPEPGLRNVLKRVRITGLRPGGVTAEGLPAGDTTGPVPD